MIDCFYPDKDYSASKFENDALKIIEKLFDENKIPIVCGGSGLYIKSLVDGIFDTVDKDEEYREVLLQIRKEKGNEALYEILKKVDPESAENMIPQNWKRIIARSKFINFPAKKLENFKKSIQEKIILNLFNTHWIGTENFFMKILKTVLMK